MSDIITVGIKVDTTDVNRANKDLAGLEGQSVKLEGSTRRVETATQSVATGFSKLTGIVTALATSYALLKTAQYIQESTMLAARYETLGVVMRVVGNNAGYTGAQMDEFAKGLQKTGISMTESRESLARMVQAHLDLNQASKLARVAQDAAVIGNINSSEAFQRIVYGIQSGQVEMLRTIGINVNFEASYQKVAAATGRVVSSFTEAEKTNIRMKATMEATTQIAGVYSEAFDTLGKKITTLPRHLQDLQVLFGAAFTPALSEIIETVTGAVVDLNGELSGKGKEKIADWGNNFRLILIDIEAEIMRLGMLIDKVGGTLTSIVMLATGVGAGLGKLGLPDLGDTKRFEAAAQANIELEARYRATEKALEGLAVKYIALEQAMAPAGKAMAEYARNRAEFIRVESVGPNAPKEEAIITEKQLHIHEQFVKDYNKLTMTKEENEIASLNILLEKYKENKEDVIKIEEMTQAGLRDIKLRAENERIALYEELYAATGERQYAELAIAAYTEVATVKQLADSLMLKSDDQATTLMTDRIQKYADKFKEVMQVVKETAKETYSTVQRESQKAMPGASEPSAMAQGASMGAGGISGMPLVNWRDNHGKLVNYFTQANDAAALAETRKTQAAAAAEQAQAAADAAKTASDAATSAAEEAARKMADIANEGINLGIQILELSGRSAEALTATRMLELAAMDESLRPLQERIYALQDEATAQEAATKATEEAAQAAKDLASAQDAAVQSWKGQISALVSQGQAIKDFINSLGATGASMSLSAARGSYMADLAGARAGDATSYGRITQSAGAYISTATKSAGSSVDAARIVAGIKGELSNLAPVVMLDANIELLKLIEKNTSSTATSAERLDTVGIKAIFDLSQVITFVANSTGIPADLRKLITDQTANYQIWLKAQLATDLSEPVKRILIDGSGIYTANVRGIISTVDEESRKLALTAQGAYLAYVNSVMGSSTLDESTRRLALTAGNAYLTIVSAALGSTNPEAMRLGLAAANTLAATVTAALGFTDPGAVDLAMKEANRIAAEVTAALGSGDPAALQLATTQANNFQTLVSAVLSGPVANQMSGLLAGIGTGSNVTLGGTVTWENSLLDLIKTATQATATNTGKLFKANVPTSTTALTQEYRVAGAFIGNLTTTTQHGINYFSDGSQESYAMGGIASGPDSGYAATLHGTELVVSPRTSYPATVKGGDNGAEQTAVLKRIQSSIEAGNLASVKNSAKIAKILSRFDDDGMPAVRTV